MKTDVIVIGGGLTGLSLTAALGMVGIPTVCIERASSATKPQDRRTTALALGSQRILKGIGVWTFLEQAAEPILTIRVADNNTRSFIHYDHRDISEEPLGWIVDNVKIQRELLQRISQLSAVRMVESATVTRIERNPWAVVVTLDDNRQIQGRVVIGADGRSSFTRRSAKIGATIHSYRQMAIIGTIEHERPHYGVAIEHFFPGGPFAVLPMTGNRSAIVWSDHETMVPRYLNLSEEEFREELLRRIGEHLGSIREVGRRMCYPLSILLCHRQIGLRLALIGEAAHAIHPVAGQGFNLGLRDVAVLSEVIVDVFRLGLDIGESDVLERYQRWRRFDNFVISMICDQLIHIFSNQHPLLSVARGLGFQVINRLGIVKRIMMHSSMGLLGELPRLARGELL